MHIKYHHACTRHVNKYSRVYNLFLINLLSKRMYRTFAHQPDNVAYLYAYMFYGKSPSLAVDVFDDGDEHHPNKATVFPLAITIIV